MAITAHVNDQLDDLVLASLNTNDRQLWKAATDALEACVIEETQQRAQSADSRRGSPDLPPHVQQILRKLAPSLHGRSFGFRYDDIHPSTRPR